jgi:hypothetical protein
VVDEVEQIMAFIKEGENGRRWIDLENEFIQKRGWSKGKFVNHWKKAKPFIEQRKLGKIGKRYFIKEIYNTKAAKSVLAKELKDQELNIIEIPKDLLEQYIPILAKRYRDNVFLNDYKFLTRRKLKSSFKNLFLQWLEENIRRHSNYWNVSVIQPLGVPALNFSEQQLFAILQILDNKSASRFFVNDPEKKSFKIILSYDPPKKELKPQVSKKRMFEAWQKDRGVSGSWEEHKEEFKKDCEEMLELYDNPNK